MGKTGDNISSGNANWKFSGKMVNDFESHVSKSVPIYNRGHELIIKLSDFEFIDNILDISTVNLKSLKFESQGLNIIKKDEHLFK